MSAAESAAAAPVHGGSNRIASVSGSIATPNTRRPASAGFDRAATFAGQQRKALACAFPHHVAAPAQRRRRHNAAGSRIISNHGIVRCQRCQPIQNLRSRVARVTSLRRIPVVTPLVDEAEPQPDRIGKIELRHRARHVGLAKDTVGGKCKGRSGKPPLRQQPGCFGSQRRRRILRVELVQHMAVDVGGQGLLERRRPAEKRCGPRRCAAATKAAAQSLR